LFQPPDGLHLVEVAWLDATPHISVTFTCTKVIELEPSETDVGMNLTWASRFSHELPISENV